MALKSPRQLVASSVVLPTVTTGDLVPAVDLSLPLHLLLLLCAVLSVVMATLLVNWSPRMTNSVKPSLQALISEPKMLKLSSHLPAASSLPSKFFAHLFTDLRLIYGSLLQSETDEALEVAVTQIFREFGVVYVKIRRDPKHMPFAFCQYTVSFCLNNFKRRVH
jgi:hypothetical protein